MDNGFFGVAASLGKEVKSAANLKRREIFCVVERTNHEII
jgi:hypothetical protein